MLQEPAIPRRLLGEDVQARGGDPPRIETLEQRRLIHQLAARCVDEDHARLHPRDRFPIDHPSRRARERRMKRDDVGEGQQLLQRDEPHVQVLREALRDERIMSDHRHAEGLRSFGHLLPHLPKPDEAERLAPQLATQKQLALPFPALHRVVGRDQMSHEREHQAERVFGDAHAVAAGRVHDEDAASRRCLQIHIVHARARATDHLQALRPLDRARRQPRLASDDHRVVVSDDRLHLRRRRRRPNVHVPSRLPQDLDPGWGDRLRDQDVHMRLS
ncbi:hypothetical protein HRbin10_02257 [bacterium HR10]|nr:hypothetical protein HRbin10_02257 [bacterium HR10]